MYRKLKRKQLIAMMLFLSGIGVTVSANTIQEEPKKPKVINSAVRNSVEGKLLFNEFEDSVGEINVSYDLFNDFTEESKKVKTLEDTIKQKEFLESLSEMRKELRKALGEIKVPVEEKEVKPKVYFLKGILKKVPKKLFSTGYIRVRDENAQEKFLLKPGEKVVVLKEENNKVKVKTKESRKGYVKRNLLTKFQKKAQKTVKAVEEFKITGYCPCSECSEGWGISTASGESAIENHTIAADLGVLPMYTEVYIEGLGRFQVEDVGGGVRGNHIDIFVGQHSQCDSKNRTSAKVFIIKG